jgi:hypothetical protein
MGHWWWKNEKFGRYYIRNMVLDDSLVLTLGVDFQLKL